MHLFFYIAFNWDWRFKYNHLKKDTYVLTHIHTQNILRQDFAMGMLILKGNLGTFYLVWVNNKKNI